MISWFQIASNRFNYLRQFFAKRDFMVYHGKLTVVGLLRHQPSRAANDDEFVIPNV